MRLDAHVYIVQIERGRYEVSAPWIEALARPIEGSSPTALKEELMFRMLELVHEELEPWQLPTLLQPQRPRPMMLDDLLITWRFGNRAPIRELLTLDVIAETRRREDGLLRVWIPSLPGACVAVASAEQIPARVAAHLAEHATVNDLHALAPLQLERARAGWIEAITLDFGYPDPVPPLTARTRRTGRLRRPETLQAVATNLTHLAADDRLSPAFGQEALVRELIGAITSARPVALCLIGPGGVGKTALVHDAARRVWPMQQLYQARRDLWQTSGDRLLAGAEQAGRWERRLSEVCDELATRGDILVIEDLLGLARAGRSQGRGATSAAEIIEPYIAQGRFGLLCEATEDAFAQASQLAPGLTARLRRVRVEELAWRDALRVLIELTRAIELRHPHLQFTPRGVEAILRVSDRLARAEAFPGKAIRLARQCEAAALSIHHQRAEGAQGHDREPVTIDPDVVARVIHQQTGLPTGLIARAESRTSTEIQELLGARVFGQREAVEALTRHVLTIEQGLSDPARPLCTMLLIGPSGVGKTESARALAELLFGHEDDLIRFDMSELSTPASITRLIGSAAQPDGELTGAVRLRPFSVVLFDEVEKAHPAVLDLLLQVMGDGRLTDAAGRTVDFTNTLLLMTSNLGAAREAHWLGFDGASARDRKLHYRRSAEAFFRPELFNRIDEVVAYAPLSVTALRLIARRTLQQLMSRHGLRQGQILVDLDDDLIQHLIDGAVDPRHGARTLARRIERALIAPLAHQLVAAQIDPRDAITRVGVRAGQGDALDLTLYRIRRAPRAPDAPEQVTTDDAFLLEPQALIDALADLDARERALSARHEIAALRAEYEALLARFNAAQQAHAAPERELGERLRQREIFLRRLGDVAGRLDGVLDPSDTGDRELPLVQEIGQRRQRLWSEAVRQITHALSWLELQQRSLTTREDDRATLIITGLSGPFEPLLRAWARYLEVMDELYELELGFVYRSGGRWHTGRLPRGDQEIVAVAVSAEAPGVTAIFRALEGYIWNPRLPSHGLHTLLSIRAHDDGISQPEALAARLAEGVINPNPAPGAQVEFIIHPGDGPRLGTIEDARQGVALPIPRDRGDNLDRFVRELVERRLHLLEDPYTGPTRAALLGASQERS